MIRVLDRKLDPISLESGYRGGIVMRIGKESGKDAGARTPSLSPKEARILAYALLMEAERREASG